MNVLTRADVERLWHQEDEDWEKVPPEVRDAIHGVADEMLSRWPEGWEMRPREPDQTILQEMEKNQLWRNVAKGVWQDIWDAYQEESK